MPAKLVALFVAALAAGGASWQQAAPVPVARSEVAAAVLGGEIVVLGGFLADGSSSRRVDAYSPPRNTWRRLPDLPFGVHHAVAAAYRGRLYSLGGYAEQRGLSRSAFVLERGRWRSLPPLPEGRAAAGATVVDGRLHVVGGVGPNGVVSRMLVLDLKRLRWSSLAGPTPREHLAVTSLKGRIYAVGGRVGGYTNSFDLFEAYTPRLGWRRLPPVPSVRSGTGAAAVGRTVVSIGGETAAGTVGSVYGFDFSMRKWNRLPDLPTPRHGLGVVAVGSRIYAVAGGPEPGLTVSGVSEYLRVG